MNNATAVVALINKCDTPEAKQRLAAAYEAASNPETIADTLESLVVDEEEENGMAQYADSVKVHRAVLSNPNVSFSIVRLLLGKHSVWYLTSVKIQFEVCCGLLMNPALPFWLMTDPGLSWLPLSTLRQLSIIAWAMRDYPKYAEHTSDLERYERVFMAIVQGREQEKGEAA